jgi:hypothetical protein
VQGCGEDVGLEGQGAEVLEHVLVWARCYRE